LSEGLVETMEGMTDEAVQNFIDGLAPAAPQITPEEFVGSEAFERYLEEKGFDDLLNKSKKAQSAFDSKMSKGFATFKKNLLGSGSGEPSGGNTGDDDLKGQGGEDNPLMALLQEMRNEIKTLKAEKQQETKLDQARKLMKQSKLPPALQDKWLGRIKLDGEAKLEDQIKP